MSETNQNRKSQYLQQCWAAVHEKQTLALDFALEAPTANDDTPVLTLHGKFSRFILGFIDNSSATRKIMNVNIRAEEAPYLIQQYELAVAEKFRAQRMPKENNTNAESLAYTVRMRAGNMKGRTPAEVLLEDPDNRIALERHITWLEGYLDKWPTNQEVIDAINDALYLYDNGELVNQADLPSSNHLTIFREDFKYMSNGTEHSKTYAKIVITCDFAQNNPWGVYIENGECPVEMGKVNRAKATDKRSGTFYLNDKEMANLISTIRNIKLIFENHMFADAYQFVDRNRWRPDPNWSAKK